MVSANSNGDAPIELHSLEEVEKLVQRLYLPGSPREITRIQVALQKIQRSQEGWQLADALLRSNDNNVRFFGALTFLMKINKDWDSLCEEDAPLLLNTLIQWLLRLVNGGAPKMVIRKLCTALISYYLRPSGIWKQPIRHLVLCLNEGDVVPSNFLDQGPPIFSILPNLSLSSILAILWFSRGLAEEVKASAPGLETQKHYERVSSNIADSVAVLQFTMRATTGPGSNLFEESISCFHDWIGYAHRAWIDKAIELDPLRQLTPLAMVALYNDDMYGVTVELFTDVLTNFSAFLNAQDFMSLSTLLTNPKAQGIISRLKEGDYDVEVMSFARLLLAYGDAAIQDLVEKADVQQFNQLVLQLLDLLSCDGYPGVEDEICAEALEFWMTYTEHLIDSLFSAEKQKPAWMDSARQRVEAVIEACWVKIRMPPSEVAITWDSDAKASFKNFRRDVEDILQSSYTLLGSAVFGKLAHLALQSLQSHAWLELEATLYCLNALSDSVADEDMVDQILSRLFGSSLFADMTNNTNSIPAKTRQTAVTMITRYATFFERNVDHLPSMLNFLFESLKASALANVAVRAIASTCSTCRKSLTSELGAFLEQYEVLLSWDSVDAYVKEKVIGAIAAIVQALPTEADKLAPLSLLFQFVEMDVASSMRFLEASQAEGYQASAACALKCLASMAKALETPDEVAIDLDADTHPQALFWTEGEGAPLQSQVIRTIQKLYGEMSWNSDIVEASCQVLRPGYKENIPGLFVFPTSATVDLVMASTLETARLDYVLETAGAMLNRHSQESEYNMRHAATSFLIHVLNLIHAMEVNRAIDPEVNSSGIELAEKMIPRYLHSMIRVQNVEKLFETTFVCLEAPDLMPKRAAAHFWASFVQKHELSGEDLQIVQAAIQQYGPQLCQILAEQIGGEAARSELDIFAEPLKKLVFAQPQAKQWLANALDSEGFRSVKVGPTEKRVWLQKIMKQVRHIFMVLLLLTGDSSLRGAKGTNNAIKDFWIACRGAEFAYAS